MYIFYSEFISINITKVVWQKYIIVMYPRKSPFLHHLFFHFFAIFFSRGRWNFVEGNIVYSLGSKEDGFVSIVLFLVSNKIFSYIN